MDEKLAIWIAVGALVALVVVPRLMEAKAKATSDAYTNIFSGAVKAWNQLGS